MATFKTQGIVLKRRDFGEADKIFVIYTKDSGKILARARGIKKAKAKLAGHLELFNHLDLVLAGRTIIGATVINHFPNLRNNLDNLQKAFYIVELVDQFTAEEDADARMFNLLLENLTEPKLRNFEEKFLHLLGVKPEKHPHNLKNYLQSALR